MNIIEAIKSGKRFRRQVSVTEGNPNWWTPVGEFGQFKTSVEDVLADDWEVEEMEIKITSSDFEKARQQVATRINKNNNFGYVHISEYLDELKKELGL